MNEKSVTPVAETREKINAVVVQLVQMCARQAVLACKQMKKVFAIRRRMMPNAFGADDVRLYVR